MSAYGLVPAFHVRQARSEPTFIPVFHKSLFPEEGSGIFTLTLFDLYQFLAVLIICLPWCIVLWPSSLINLRLCSQDGFPGLDYHWSLLQITVHISLPSSEKNLACSLVSLIQRQPHSILRVMVW